MAETIETDLCVIGAGSGGLSVAAGASQMGARVVLIEKGKMGGDCLNTGCVPSKSLIAAAHAADTMRRSDVFGVNGHAPEVRFQAVHDHVHGVIAAIAPNDSVERFEGLGVRVIKAEARFTGPTELVAGDARVRAKRIVVATGSRAAAPPIPGLADVPYLTNETIFDLTERPEHLVIIGGGPIGCEMAQAHRRLGARVTVLDLGKILPKDDPEAVAVVRDRLTREGVAIREGIKIERIEAGNEGPAVVLRDGDTETRVGGSHLLVAAGRKPNVEGLNLETAGIEYGPRGITVDARLRTSNKKVFAVGDVAGGFQFTHMAAYHAGIVIRNTVFRLPAKVDYSAVPWVTYTDPELAQVGLNEGAARDKHGEAVRVLTWPFAENDRAQTERATEGRIKVIVGRRGKVLGATVVGRHAGEIIGTWALAVSAGLKIKSVANMIVPYPTLGEVSKRAAGSYYTDTLFGPRTRKIVSWLQRLP
ncbi:MAG: dihydrolipoamide dehydrogenase [Rhodospirillales bacterium]|nr:MAG: dihydrolipoamide dehydrogenase [Rhodospirillales bacterium]